MGDAELISQHFSFSSLPGDHVLADTGTAGVCLPVKLGAGSAGHGAGGSVEQAPAVDPPQGARLESSSLPLCPSIACWAPRGLESGIFLGWVFPSACHRGHSPVFSSLELSARAEVSLLSARCAYGSSPRRRAVPYVVVFTHASLPCTCSSGSSARRLL